MCQCICTSTRFLYYFCLCKSFKELLLHTNRPDFWAKADAKVQKITIQTKLFNENITKLMKVFAFVDKRVFLGTKKEENFAIYDAKFSSI